ncbi:hypothetical protein RJ641_020266 [Dillenia turbinata]|uniref:Uncharacterized protein n=1 Tax=Dillenia turbinata TaxID=194707 RepID=A0AAN8YTY8_9MAGN
MVMQERLRGIRPNIALLMKTSLESCHHIESAVHAYGHLHPKSRDIISGLRGLTWHGGFLKPVNLPVLWKLVGLCAALQCYATRLLKDLIGNAVCNKILNYIFDNVKKRVLEVEMKMMLDEVINFNY